ncbi:MAG: tRNA epoxyqueuosine(34) reductase QueG [Bacteroidales bacterium]|nr:tRNA epoxyqueuosine(34) reductase QueG [Bacteroidales bacterium]
MIKMEAGRLGFDACGISPAACLEDGRDYLKSWLTRGFHGCMSYMENNADKRVDPTLLVPGAKSVISVLINYFPATHQHDPEAPVISKYAYGEDYHRVVRKKMKLLFRFIQESVTPVTGRYFVDSAPVLEKAWAARAGLGWIGKNTCLISKKLGSFVFIGELVVDIPLRYDKPVPDYCGTCTRCIDACPTGALVAPYQLDARRCISYLTIENKGEPGQEFQGSMMNRVFGCDICQDVCPWNRKAVSHNVKEFNPKLRLMAMTHNDWYRLDEQQYEEIFARSAVKRTGFDGLRRNLSIISGPVVKR